MATDLAQAAKSKGIKYFLISFVDLFGTLRAKLVPARAIKDMQRDGAGFAGFAAWLDMTPADADMFGIPDPSSLIQLVRCRLILRSACGVFSLSVLQLVRSTKKPHTQTHVTRT